jgi:hypothetical protein
MLTDSERWRFLADHGLTLHTDGGDLDNRRDDFHWYQVTASETLRQSDYLQISELKGMRLPEIQFSKPSSARLESTSF